MILLPICPKLMIIFTPINTLYYSPLLKYTRSMSPFLRIDSCSSVSNFVILMELNYEKQYAEISVTSIQCAQNLGTLQLTRELPCSCVTICGDITFAAPNKIHPLTQFKQHQFHRCFQLVNSWNQKFEGFF